MYNFGLAAKLVTPLNEPVRAIGVVSTARHGWQKFSPSPILTVKHLPKKPTL